MPEILPLRGEIQHYAWGGYEYLPTLLGAANPDHRPWAELWLGAHPKGPAHLPDGRTLETLIAAAPAAVLGPQVAERFSDRLPFLLKVLDVREMLSIQVHPAKAAAERGFAREEREGPARDAPSRNYRDDNHKPELGVAVTDFYLLHGFRPQEDIAETLHSVPGWSGLLPLLERGGVRGLYRHVMELPVAGVDELLRPLADGIGDRAYAPDQPEHWVRRAIEQYGKDGHYDRGIFSIYWLNLLRLPPGAGIFQAAGIPHAYLRGVCIELMANSDNVLRGGLTPKHIDVPELLDNVDFTAVDPQLLRPSGPTGNWTAYPTPAPDFTLRTARLSAGATLAVKAGTGPAILLLLEGEAVAGTVGLAGGQRSLFLPAESETTLRAETNCHFFLATVGTASAH